MSRAVLILANDTIRNRAAAWARNAPVNTRVEFREPRRSDEQNRLMWARLTQIAREVDWYGQKLSSEDWKDIFTASLKKARVVPGIDPGSFVVLGMRTSQMSVSEMSNLMELIGAFAAERGVELIA